jgi:hypothetical protein
LSLPRLAALSAAIVIAACGGEPSAGDLPSAVVRDSSGVAIVENVTPRWGPEESWRVNARPQLVIGVLEGDSAYQLFGVTDALRLPDGRIAIANAGSREIRFYDPAGLYLSTVGGEGDGPGEFRDIGWFEQLSPDTLVAYDYRAKRLSLFSAGGSFLSSATPQPPEGEPNPLFVGHLDDGSLLAVSLIAITPGTKPGLQRSSQLLVRYRPDGTFVDSVGRFPGRETYVTISETGQVTASALPLGHRAAYAASDAGIYVGGAERPEFGLFATDGRLLRVVRWDEPPRPVTPAMIAEVKRIRSQGWDELDPQFRARLEAMQEELPWPEELPVYARFIADAEENLWVERFSSPSDSLATWTVFDREGILLGRVQTPGDLRILQIGSDFILGVARDAMDVEQVRVHALEKPRTPAGRGEGGDARRR